MSTNDSDRLRIELMRKMSWVVRSNMNRNMLRMEEFGLSRGHAPLLMELKRHGKLNQRELADIMHVTPATMSGTLKRMVKAGIVARESIDTDARVQMVSLTERGQEMLEDSVRRMDDAGGLMLSVLSDEECEVLGGILEKLAVSIREGKCGKGGCD